LLGSALYFDAQVEFAERLVVENALDARDRGAEVVTYAPVTRIIAENGAVTGVEFVSEGETQVVRASVVINAAGPWVDELLERAPVESSRLIGGTKGSHIVVPAFPGASKNAIYLEAQSDRRPLFIIPWNGNYLIGTTDVRFEEDPDEVRSESWEIDYLLAETNRAFPGARLTREQILFTYSGVRPLPWTRNEDEKSITRRHFIREHPKLKNLVSIVGGKLTTYRSLAEECVDLVFRRLGRQSPPCVTGKEVLPAAPVRDFAEAVVFSFEHELAKTLADCFLRRTMRGLSADLGLGDLDAAAEIGKTFLGWSDERAKREVENYSRRLRG